MAYQKALDLTVPGVDTAASLHSLQIQLIGVELTALLFVIGFSYLLARSISTPIDHLRTLMFNIEQGQLNQRAEIIATDEIGHLGIAFNTMMSQLEALQVSTEKIISERTHALERRTAQLHAIASLSRKATEIRDLPSLLNNVVHLITEQFGFYHTGIFLIDENRRFAVLQAASSEGGRKMLEAGHRLQLGVQGIVGYVAAQGRPRIALDVEADSVFFNNPYLPFTRSEMALPLIAREQIIGVLDIQSDQPQAFSPDDIEILQTLADQLAIAIENARLFGESQAIIAQLEALTMLQTRQAWEKFIARRRLAYQYTPLGVTPLSTEKPTSLPGKTGKTLEIPLQLRGQIIGTITLSRSESAPNWTNRDRELASEIANQIALAVDNSRLLEEIQRSAARDHLVANISSRIRETLDLETVLQTAVVEFQKAFGLKEAEIRLEPPPASTSNGRQHNVPNGHDPA
ncbi:MAG: GAF domain-containing protein [Anaerolineae bacterium]